MPGSKHRPLVVAPRAGFTLLELVVVLGVFAVLVTTLTGAFVSTVRVERRTFASQETLSSTRYAIELMARAIRQAQPDSVAIVTTRPGCAATSCLTFRRPNNEEVEYVHCQTVTASCPATGRLFQRVGAGNLVPLTPAGIDVQAASFTLLGEAPAPDTVQPRVTVSLSVAPTTPAGLTTLNVQTTISLRNAQL
jgi:prepilin-type N-terminal cleavage/methylation domain-containing protein